MNLEIGLISLTQYWSIGRINGALNGLKQKLASNNLLEALK